MSAPLFSEQRVSDIIDRQTRKIGPRVLEIPADKILNASEYDLVQALVAEGWISLPVIEEESIYIERAEEAQIDVSKDPMRIIDDRSRPVWVTGHETVIAVPYKGKSEFFRVQPNTFSTSPPRAEIGSGVLLLRYLTTDHDPDGIKKRYLATVKQIKEHLGWLSKVVDPYNKQLEKMIGDAVRARKEKLLADANMVAALDLPMKRREGVPTTYAAPIRRRAPQIEEIKVAGPFKPEPAIAMSDYEEILRIMKSMAQVMELSPNAFVDMEEEALRTHFLVQLNGAYKGQATGETFNFQGKTDILIRINDRNVFIAECKFWKGEKAFLETIDQLLSYLSWRDTKAAVVVFNRNADFTAVLAKIEEIVPKHECFKHVVGKSDETTFRYVFKQPSDANREITLTVLAFDIPTAM